jgi:hypothetical protein
MTSGVKNNLMSLPGYQVSDEISGYLTEASNTVRPFANASWLPWAAYLLPELVADATAEDARQKREAERQKREDERFALFSAGKMSSEDYMAGSEDEDVMIIDDSGVGAKPAPSGPSRNVEITDLSSGSTAINAKAKGSAKPAVKVEVKAKAKAKTKGKEKVVDKPNREPPNIPRNATKVRPFFAFLLLDS